MFTHFNNCPIVKSTRYWPINIINYHLDFNCIYFRNKNKLYNTINYNFNNFFNLIIFLFPTKFSYIFLRLKTFMDPSKGDSFQTDKALAAIKQGGLKGQGMGEGILKESVPEAHTDYIIAVITEEFGSFVSIGVITIFLYISYKIIKNCINNSDDLTKISLVDYLHY